jgi:hypothetical protein
MLGCIEFLGSTNSDKTHYNVVLYNMYPLLMSLNVISININDFVFFARLLGLFL